MPDVLFPAGDDVDFSITVKKDGVVVDLSTATSIEVAICTRTTPRVLIGSKVSCSSGNPSADWANGVVTGTFTGIDDAEIGDNWGWQSIQLQYVISSNTDTFLLDKAVKIVDTV